MLYTFIIERTWIILTTPEYEEWYLKQTEKHKQQIRARIRNIELKGYFGNNKTVSNDNSVWELKWTEGRRIYYAYLRDSKILLLLGGNKNGQSKDITKAKKIYQRYE